MTLTQPTICPHGNTVDPGPVGRSCALCAAAIVPAAPLDEVRALLFGLVDAMAEREQQLDRIESTLEAFGRLLDEYRPLLEKAKKRADRVPGWKARQ